MKNQYKSGFIALVGRPNVGKSTLLNALMGQKIAIMSDKPQTTRNKIQGIYTDADSQMIFIDTPGVHKPQNELGSYMNQAAQSAIGDVDVICYMISGPEQFGTGDQFVLDLVKRTKKPLFLLVNKVDIMKPEKLVEVVSEVSQHAEFTSVIPISAMSKVNVDVLLDEIKKVLPAGPQYYDDTMVTDSPERFIMAELVREKVLHLTNEEVPHSVAVITEEVKREEDGRLFVRCVIIVERQGQKGIIIGKQGQLIKKIGQRARRDMERIFDESIHLETFVKVEPKWRDKQLQLQNFGYNKKEIE